ncbi:MAG TPA: D-alanyl-D-alanine carboxypeptidase family protein [Miltoncostaeaceae bacterium]|nr:D-alanyl-D-alanine carboxypeptidase family protein [Miltoncostaeaceae bacterium]
MLRRPAVLAVMAILLAAVPGLAAAPRIAAPAYIVLNPATDEVLAQRAADRELPMASTTKIMTALIVLERADLDDTFTVPPEAVAVGGSTARLEEGEQISVRDLLTGLLVASGNDAAVTLADGVAGSQAAFVRMMNARAEELGLRHTHFANPHGLDAPGHHSSVRDLVTLAEVAMENPVFREDVASRRATIPGPGGVGERPLESENELLDIDPEADGVKTGMTDGAGYALVAHAGRSGLGLDLYLASLRSPSSDIRARDARALLDDAFSHYARARLLEPGTVVARAQVDGVPGATIPIVPAAALDAPLRLGEPVTATLVAPQEVEPPVERGDVVGTITYRQNDRAVGRMDLVAGESAGGPGLLDRLRAGWEELVP